MRRADQEQVVFGPCESHIQPLGISCKCATACLGDCGAEEDDSLFTSLHTHYVQDELELCLPPASYVWQECIDEVAGTCAPHARARQTNSNGVLA